MLNPAGYIAYVMKKVFNSTLDALKVENVGSNAYDDTNDVMKTSSNMRASKLISLSSITDIADAGTGNTDWLNDDDVGKAKTVTVYYTATKNHDLVVKFDYANPAATGYFGATTVGNYHSGSVGGLGSVSQRFTFDINDKNLQFNFTNNSGDASKMDITNLYVRLQF